MTPALAFIDVAHRFGEVLALQQVSFQVPAGDILCLLGPSGCGKTTALRIAAGLERPHSGQIQLDGQTVSGPGIFVEPEQRGVGLLFQDYALFPHLTVERNVAFGLKGLPAAERQRRVRDWLERVELWHRRQAYPHMLSGGEQQRVALARALAPQPAVLLLDEPFSNLDTQLRQQVREDVLRTVKDSGTAALMVTHDPEEALYMGDQIALMDHGQVLQQGAAAELYTRPLSPLVATFFGDVNRLPGRVEAGQVPTPLGLLPAPGFADGTDVEVLLRTEGIRLSEQTATSLEPSANATVTTVRRLGQISRVDLETLPTTGALCSLKVHVMGPTAYQAGDRVRVVLDPTLAFVFPAAGAAADSVQ